MLSGKNAVFAAMLLLFAGISQAAGQSIETRGDHCNDTYFNSDGSGITGCINLALRLNGDLRSRCIS